MSIINYEIINVYKNNNYKSVGKLVQIKKELEFNNNLKRMNAKDINFKTSSTLKENKSLKQFKNMHTHNIYNNNFNSNSNKTIDIKFLYLIKNVSKSLAKILILINLI